MSESLLPPNASQLERAASDAARIDDLDLTPVSNLWNPWECHISVLPYLAWALSVDVWDEDWPEKVKRTVVAESIGLHWIKGTPGAVEQMCAALGYEVDVLEWPEYGGGHDRYKLRAYGRMDEADYENILIADHVAKRQSQELDAIQIPYTEQAAASVAGLPRIGFSITGSLSSDVTSEAAPVAGAAIVRMSFPITGMLSPTDISTSIEHINTAGMIRLGFSITGAAE
ncbi:phage tail protein I [Desulfovibrio sp. JC010]|uniref:phage tail protein I n=1 Tax=Desulfovibrio sp. JC010 TaxID=2593641 RepID=UPI0013D775D4|nr:phage tail protein I [Desulfovibrio sp. JC010]